MQVGCDGCCNAACPGTRPAGRGTRGVRSALWIVSSQCYSSMKERMGRRESSTEQAQGHVQMLQGRIWPQPKQREREGVGAEGGFGSSLSMTALCDGARDPHCARSLDLLVRMTPRKKVLLEMGQSQVTICSSAVR